MKTVFLKIEGHNYWVGFFEDGHGATLIKAVELFCPDFFKSDKSNYIKE